MLKYIEIVSQAYLAKDMQQTTAIVEGIPSVLKLDNKIVMVVSCFIIYLLHFNIITKKFYYLAILCTFNYLKRCTIYLLLFKKQNCLFLNFHVFNK